MVVDQLVEQLLLTPEVRDSNPVIGKIYIERLLSTVLKKTKKTKKEAGNLNNVFSTLFLSPILSSVRPTLSLSGNVLSRCPYLPIVSLLQWQT